jgi:hypothetical protein
MRFCEECGGKLELTCPACGAAVPPGRKFCGRCGESLSRLTNPTSRFQPLSPTLPGISPRRFSSPRVAHCHLGLGKLSRRTGERDQARGHLTTATTLYPEMDIRFWLEQAEAESRELA